MKNILFLLAFTLFFCSCSDDVIIKKISNESSKLSISGYYTVGDKRTKELVYETEKKDDIKKILGYISSEDASQGTCGYNGIIELKLSKGGFMNMEFNTSDCNKIVYTYEDIIYSRKISPEGISFINGLIKK
jgi:hypothetical protein